MNKYSRAFFDWLEGVSDWIDNEIDRGFVLLNVGNHIDRDREAIRTLNVLSSKTRLRKLWLEIEIKYVFNRMLALKEFYNSEKYFWMKSK